MSRQSSIIAFRKAVELLRSIDPDLSLLSTGSTLCLMKDDNTIDIVGALRISSGASLTHPRKELLP